MGHLRTFVRPVGITDGGGTGRQAPVTRASSGQRQGWSGEYVVGTVAAGGFSVVLFKVITSPQVHALVRGVIGKAFKLAF